MEIVTILHASHALMWARLQAHHALLLNGDVLQIRTVVDFVVAFIQQAILRINAHRAQIVTK